jgi:Ca2+-binding EF-hand superfamily protein
MNERRRSLIEKVFQIYDKENKGKLEFSNLKVNMDVSQNKDLIFSKKSREEIINIFLSNFNCQQISK